MLGKGERGEQPDIAEGEIGGHLKEGQGRAQEGAQVDRDRRRRTRARCKPSHPTAQGIAAGLRADKVDGAKLLLLAGLAPNGTSAAAENFM